MNGIEKVRKYVNPILLNMIDTTARDINNHAQNGTVMAKKFQKL